jgi:hypothetical protein
LMAFPCPICIGHTSGPRIDEYEAVGSLGDVALGVAAVGGSVGS